MTARRTLRTRSGSVADRVLAHLATLPPGTGLDSKGLAAAVGYAGGPIGNMIDIHIRSGLIAVKTPLALRAGKGNPATYLLTDLGRQQIAGAVVADEKPAASKKRTQEDPLAAPRRTDETDADYEDCLFTPLSPPVDPDPHLNSVFSFAAGGRPDAIKLGDPNPQLAPNLAPPTRPTGLYWTPAAALPAYRTEPTAPSARPPEAAADAISWPAASGRFDALLRQLGCTPSVAPASAPLTLDVAVWMDGSLLIVRGGRQLHLSAAHTQQLRRFLAQTHPVT